MTFVRECPRNTREGIVGKGQGCAAAGDGWKSKVRSRAKVSGRQIDGRRTRLPLGRGLGRARVLYCAKCLLVREDRNAYDLPACQHATSSSTETTPAVERTRDPIRPRILPYTLLEQCLPSTTCSSVRPARNVALTPLFLSVQRSAHQQTSPQRKAWLSPLIPAFGGCRWALIGGFAPSAAQSARAAASRTSRYLQDKPRQARVDRWPDAPAGQACAVSIHALWRALRDLVVGGCMGVCVVCPKRNSCDLRIAMRCDAMRFTAGGAGMMGMCG